MPSFRAFRAVCFAGFVTLAILPAQATDWPKSDIPPDPAVTFGVLGNGMRYAIQHNATPTGEVSIRFRIAAGSLQESDDQRGLAHFLEHMAFRGSAHVADGDINKTLERLGLRFGSDTNASTGQEETVYQFDLPKSDDRTVDTALSFTREIASNLTLDPAAAKTEAGVVLSELKLRDLPSFRASQARLDFFLKDKHATALPNGDATIIAAAPVERIRDFYQTYYQPERATLIIVGDIDPARIEAKIKTAFADWKGVAPAGRDPRLFIARSRDLEASTYAEAGASSSITLAWLSRPDSKPSDKADEKAELIEAVALRILGRRFQEAASSAARPFTRASASRDDDLHAVKLATMSVGYEPGKWQTALDAAERIRLNALENGVTQAELDRALVELHNSFQSASAGAATRPSRGIAGSILGEVEENDVYTSPERDAAAFDEDVKGLSVGDVNRALRVVFDGGGPLIFVSGDKPIEGGEQAVKAAFLAAEKSAHAPSPAAAEVAAATPWPYTDFGKSGTVVSTEQVADLGTTFVRFANGVRLTIRPSKLSANQVLVSVKVGGGRLDLPRDRKTAAWAAGAMVSGGLNALSYTDMQRVLSGKNYNVRFGVGEDGYTFTGDTTPGDIDTQMQVLAAYVQAPGYRPESFERYRTSYVESLRQSGNSPSAVLQLRTPEILHDGDKRWASASAEDVEGAKVEDLRALLSPALAKGAIDVTIAGDITTDKAIQAVAATFGAFAERTQARIVAGADNTTRFPAGDAVPVKIATADQTGQSIVSVAWPTHGRFPDIQDGVTLTLMSAIMQERLFDRLRGLGTVYVAEVGNNSSKVFDYGYIQALAQLPPDQTQKFHDAIKDIIADLDAGKVSADDLARAKNPALEELREARQTNSYWLSVLDDAQESPGKLDLARKYEDALQNVTEADISAAARKYLTEPSAIRLAIGPA